MAVSRPRRAQAAKLIIGLLLSDKAMLPAVADRLKAMYGDVDMLSPWFGFDFTEYYRQEMGAPLHRRILVFQQLIRQTQLARIKLATNEVEQAFAEGDRRRVNIDPGYLLLERFVLATGKNYSHRIYIGERIYADLTLIYRDGDYQTLPWTYPDYADPKMRAFLREVRLKYGLDLKAQYGRPPNAKAGDGAED